VDWQTTEARYKAMVYDTIANMNTARCPHCDQLLEMLNIGANENPKGCCPNHQTVYWVEGTRVYPLPDHRQPPRA